MGLGPTGAPFLLVLLIAFTSCFLVGARNSRVAVQLVAGVAALATGATFGAALVNRHYGYYDSWSSIFASAGDTGTVSLAAAYRSMGSTAMPRSTGRAATALAAPLSWRQAYRGRGLMVRLSLDGASTGIHRTGYVYLPPQYRDPSYGAVRFPVLELLHGDPGNAAGWVYALHVRRTMDQLISHGRIGPLVLVMPATTTGARGQECMDATHGARDDAYLSADVPARVAHLFRVRAPGEGWAVAGLSEGGFCAANLGLRHRDVFQAVGSMDGYFQPANPRRTAAQLFGGDLARVEANNPLHLLQLDKRRPVPAFWLMAGTSDRGDMAATRNFAKALGRDRPSYLLVVEGGAHDAPAWRAALPALFEWSWTNLSGAATPTGVHLLRLPR